MFQHASGIQGYVMRSKGNMGYGIGHGSKGNREIGHSKDRRFGATRAITRKAPGTEQSRRTSSSIHIALRNTADYHRYPKKRKRRRRERPGTHRIGRGAEER